MSADVFVGNIDRSLTSADLKDLFSQFSSVERARIVTEKATGESKGFGFVTFSDPQEATAAITQLNGHEWSGRALTVSPARPKDSSPRPRDRGKNNSFAGPTGVKELYVTGLSHEYSSDDLRNLFSKHGNVLNAKVILDRETKQSRGFGFVQMSNVTENQDAIAALDGVEINSSRLSVREARPRSDAPRRNNNYGERRQQRSRRQ